MSIQYSSCCFPGSRETFLFETFAPRCLLPWPRLQPTHTVPAVFNFRMAYLGCSCGASSSTDQAFRVALEGKEDLFEKEPRYTRMHRSIEASLARRFFHRIPLLALRLNDLDLDLGRRRHEAFEKSIFPREA